MGTYDELIGLARSRGLRLEFEGPQRPDAPDQLAAALGVELPLSYGRFLREYGGGGAVGSWISGIYEDQPLLEGGGSAYGDTIRFREEYAMPHSLVVIYNVDDEIVWCLDTSQRGPDGECPVVSFDAMGSGEVRTLFDSFDAFLRNYLSRR